MSQYFLLTAEMRSLSVREVFALSDEEAFDLFRELRWGKGDEVVCPECGVVEQHWFLPSRRQWRPPEEQKGRPSRSAIGREPESG